ncbi:phospholipase D family protein [Planococcus sp. APC 4015]|nr:phospholipase D family protein [Planococcus sp. APC 4015]
MLDPQTRAALSEQLAPPPGFELGHAVGTSFTLDLETALTIPLSFASHRISASDGNLGILDAVRRAADRIDIFAQAGEISMGGRSDLVAFLERIVHPVTVRRGLFHPKVWFVEYASGDERAYRFICASRNLTADRSWDVVVRLDGRIAGGDKIEGATARNAPLAALLRRLPELAVQPLDDERKARIYTLADRIGTVDWEWPDGIRGLSFHALGLAGATLPELRGQRALIISPFVSDDGLATLRRGIRTDTHLISRADTLDRLAPASLGGRLRTAVLDDAASLLDQDARTDDSGALEPLTGLHAKAIIIDRQDGAQILLGSANATGAALRDNIEVMVGLTGPVPRFGVQATLEAMGALVENYAAQGGKQPTEDEESQYRLERALRSLADIRITARVLTGDSYSLAVSREERTAARADELTDGISVHWHLLTRPDAGGRGLPGVGDDPSMVADLALTDITPFMVLSARDLEGNERRTIVLAQLIDDVDTRRDAIIARQLTDRGAFVRLLMLLLELSGQQMPTGGAGAGFFAAAGAGGDEGAGLFESLVRAVGSGHGGLADVRRIVDYLLTTDDGGTVLPAGFAELWAAVWAAHEQLTGTEKDTA